MSRRLAPRKSDVARVRKAVKFGLDNLRHHCNIAVFLSIYHRLSNNPYEFVLFAYQ